MDWAGTTSSPMTMTLSWLDVFRALDQWEVVAKLKNLSEKSNSVGTGSTGFVHLCSPDVAHLMVNTHGVIRLFHHFHHDADDGLNDGTNALWALMGSGGIASAMTIDTQQVNERQIGTPCDWSKMLAWNSTADVLATINELMTTGSPAPRVNDDTPRAGQPAPAPKGRPRKASAPRRGRTKTRKDTTDDDDDPDMQNEAEAEGTADVMVVGFTMKPTVPVPAFLAAAIMESYATDPAELALTIVRTIKRRASDDPDPDRATALAEAASYVPRWILSVAINTRTMPGTTKRGVGASPAYCKRADDWAKTTHMRYLAVKARSLLPADPHDRSPGRAEDAIRNLSTLLERQVANAVSTPPPAPKSGFDSFPPSTKRMILFVSERDAQGRAPARPVQSFVDILALSNVAYVQNHIHHFLRNTKGRDAFIPMGFCAAIRTASFLADAADRPGAFSLFCCGPQTLARSAAAGKDSSDHASTLVQMQLKTTDTTTGFSDKDIKSMTKLNFTVPRDFHELARLLDNMAGVTELLFGAHSHLTHMLDEWNRFLTRTVGSTLATLRQLAHEDHSAACRLGWFIEKRMQQYLVLCAGVDREDEINPSLLEFRATRQQLEDGAFVFPACDFLKEKLGRSSETKAEATPAAAGAAPRPGRRGQAADAVINPQQDLFPKDANDNWQVFLDHVRNAPIPNMCCRWHLNGKCFRSCFLSASHVALTTEQTASVRTWIEQCRARMRRSSPDATPPGKKTKLGPSAPAYPRSTFVAKPSQWSHDRDSSYLEFHNRRPVLHAPFRPALQPQAFLTNTTTARTAHPQPAPRNASEIAIGFEDTPRAPRLPPHDRPGSRRAGTAPDI